MAAGEEGKLEREGRRGVLVGCGLAIMRAPGEEEDTVAQSELWRMAEELGLLEWGPELTKQDKVFRITSENLRKWYEETREKEETTEAGE